MRSCDLDHIKDTLEAAQEENKPAILLIGAGCSVTAGIPTAEGLIKEIAERFPNKIRRVPEPRTYAGYMAALNPAEQQQILKRHIEQARINWAHIAIALLMKEGYVGRVLTTNFDPLLVRACALLGLFPAVYDMATAQGFQPYRIPEQAIFYLHGQHTGFRLLNTEKELDDHAEQLKPLFDMLHGTGSTWIVVGYSGANDRLVKRLNDSASFPGDLYWVGYQEQEPAPEVQKGLLTGREDTYLVRGHDADSFFVRLTQQLDLFPPPFVRQPFSHMAELLKQVVPSYRIPGKHVEVQVLKGPLEWIASAAKEIEAPAAIIADAKENLMRGDYAAVSGLADRLAEYNSPELADLVAIAYWAEGNALADQAAMKSGAAADDLYAAAGEKYAQALQIKPDLHQALNNWGNALSDQAALKSDAEADALYEAAGEKYAQALQIKPDKHGALYNWGNALQEQAKMKSGAKADALFAAACEKYAQALQIKPDKHEALNNWGNALQEQAKMKSGAKADDLYARAGEKYAQALQFKPDDHDALNNWGLALQQQAEMKSGTEADALFEASYEKYAQALQIKPDYHEALYTWGNALQKQAAMKSGAEADALFEASYEKYAQALQIKPDYHEALISWGAALATQAAMKRGAAADALFAGAGEKYAQALQIKPDMHLALICWSLALQLQAAMKSGAEADALLTAAHEKCLAAEALQPGAGAYNLACISALRGDAPACRHWLETSDRAGTLPAASQIRADRDLASVRDTGWFQDLLARLELDANDKETP